MAWVPGAKLWFPRKMRVQMGVESTSIKAHSTDETGALFDPGDTLTQTGHSLKRKRRLRTISVQEGQPYHLVIILGFAGLAGSRGQCSAACAPLISRCRLKRSTPHVAFGLSRLSASIQTYERDAGIDAFVAEGSLHPNTGSVFRVGGQPITLYRHQAQSIAKAAARQSFVVTTGTGSGKSLCFFVPIIDATIRARVAGEAPNTCGRNLSHERACE